MSAFYHKELYNNILRFTLLIYINFELLLFFNIAGIGELSIGLNISRIAVLTFCLLLIILFIAQKFQIEILVIKDKNIRNSGIFFALFLVSGLLTRVIYLKDDFLFYDSNLGLLSLKNYRNRFLIDLFSYIYSFIFFLIVPYIYFSPKENADKLIKSVTGIGLISILIGYIDFGFLFLNIELIPRHINEMIEGYHVKNGYRLHGLSGEPRDAFIHFSITLALIHLYNPFQFSRKQLVGISLLIGLALILTQSFSGMISLVLFSFIVCIFLVFKYPLKGLIFSLIILLGIIAFIFFASKLSYRTDDYLKAIFKVKDHLDLGLELPYPFNVQSTNIYPVYSILLEILNGNLLYPLFGHGFGAASLENVKFTHENSVHNPYALITRLLFENGLLGSLCFLYFFKKMLPEQKESNFYLWIIFIVICCLIHKNISLYIFVSIVSIMEIRKRISYMPCEENFRN